MAVNTAISSKLFLEIGTIGESGGFTDYTAAQMDSNNYSTVTKSLEIQGSAVDAATTDDGGKALLMADIKTAADAYLATILTDGSSTYNVNIYVLNVTRSFAVSDAIAAANYLTGKYVPHKDEYTVSLRFDIERA